jgi:hypothetical protein
MLIVQETLIVRGPKREAEPGGIPVHAILHWGLKSMILSLDGGDVFSRCLYYMLP